MTSPCFGIIRGTGKSFKTKVLGSPPLPAQKRNTMKTKTAKRRSGRVRLRLKSKFDTEYANCGEREFKALQVKGDVLEIRKDGELRFYQVLGFLETESTRGRRGTLFAVERDRVEANRILLDAEKPSPPVRVWLHLVDRRTGARRYLGTEPHEFVVAPRTGE